MDVAYVDLNHTQTEDEDRAGEYDVQILVKVTNIGRPDAACLADVIERATRDYIEKASG
jgi:hypothetical protein